MAVLGAEVKNNNFVVIHIGEKMDFKDFEENETPVQLILIFHLQKWLFYMLHIIYVIGMRKQRWEKS